MTARQDPWSFLRQFTHARIAIGRAGHGTPTKDVLDFRLAHSKARDSVWGDVDFTTVRQNLQCTGYEVFEIQSKCHSKMDFLLNPDHGRVLNLASENLLKAYPGHRSDVVLIIADGLSANAVHQNGLDFAKNFLHNMKSSGITVGPVILGTYARVALGDAIGAALGARSTVMLIGERPGLASAESLGVYYTYGPGAGKTDANRNCISNIHSMGLSPTGAATMTEHLITTSFRLQLSGVDLKVEYPALTAR